MTDPYILPYDIIADMERRLRAGEYNDAPPVGLASLIQTARVQNATLEYIYQVARYGEEGCDDYENLNTIIERAGRLIGKPEAEWHR